MFQSFTALKCFLIRSPIFTIKNNILVHILVVCFFIEQIYLITNGLINPFIERLEEQHLSFSVCLVICSIVPPLIVIYNNKFNFISLFNIIFVVAIFLSFFVHTIGNGYLMSRVESDLVLSSTFILRGLTISLAVRIFSVERKFFYFLFFYVLVLSTIYSIVVMQQLINGCLVPGIGGATYQTASYIAATFSLILFNSNQFLSKSNIFSRTFIMLIALFMVFALFYNGGRGALLALILYFIGALYFGIRKLFFGNLNIYNLVLPAFVFLSFSFITISFIVDSSFLFSPSFLRGFNRTIEIFTSLFTDGLILSESVSYRDYVFVFIIDSIKSSPLFGYGPYWSTRLLTPSHNLILDIFVQFGFICGFVILLYVLYRFYYLYSHSNKCLRPFLYTTVVYLLLSGSYLFSFEFWFLLNFCSEDDS